MAGSCGIIAMKCYCTGCYLVFIFQSDLYLLHPYLTIDYHRQYSTKLKNTLLTEPNGMCKKKHPYKCVLSQWVFSFLSRWKCIKSAVHYKSRIWYNYDKQGLDWKMLEYSFNIHNIPVLPELPTFEAHVYCRCLWSHHRALGLVIYMASLFQVKVIPRNVTPI